MQRRRRGGYSIAAVLLLTAAIALLLGLAPELFRIPHDRRGFAVFNATVGFLGGGLVGALIGFSYENRGSGLLLGALVGSLCGLVGGVILIAGINVAVAVIGSVTMIGVGLAVRFGAVIDAAFRGGFLPPRQQLVRPGLAVLFTLAFAVQFVFKLKTWSFPQGAAIELPAYAVILTIGLAASIGLLYGVFRRSKSGDTPPQ
jgi:hypothetical protein